MENTYIVWLLLIENGNLMSNMAATCYANWNLPVCYMCCIYKCFFKILFSLIPGRFLCDAGWFFDSGKVYKACLVLCEPDISSDGIGRALECSVRCVLTTLSSYYKLKSYVCHIIIWKCCIVCLDHIWWVWWWLHWPCKD